MDQYTARWALIAEQHDTIIGPFCVPVDTDSVTEFNLDGTVSIHRKGIPVETRKASRLSEMRPVKSWYVEDMRKKHADGFYDGYEQSFFDDMRNMNKYGIGVLSKDDMLWLRSVSKAVRINSAKVV